jgi:hypothetical protein
MRNTIFYKQNSSDASIEDLIKQLGDIQYENLDQLRSGQKNTKLGDTLSTEADNEKVLDLLSQYLTHPSRGRSNYNITQIDRSLRNAVVLKDYITARLILNSGLANSHYRPQTGGQSAYELIEQNSEEIQDIQQIIDNDAISHQQYAPEFVRSPALFRRHIEKIKRRKQWMTRQSQQRSIISSLVPFSGKRILDYKSLWGMCLSSGWIMAQKNHSSDSMNNAFYALTGFSGQHADIDGRQAVFDAFQKITMILQTRNPHIRGVICYQSMQTLCDDPEALEVIEAKVKAIQPDFFARTTMLRYNPKNIPTIPAGNRRTLIYDEAVHPIMDICVYGDKIQDELNQLARLVNDACAKIDSSSPRYQAQVLEAAARLHHGIIAIHPFVDGNGRTARFLARRLCEYYGFTLASDDKLKSDPARWDVNNTIYQAHGDDCSAYDVSVASDFDHMHPYKNGVSELYTDHFVEWVVEKNHIRQQSSQQSVEKTEASTKTTATEKPKSIEKYGIDCTDDGQDRPRL